MDKKSQAPPSVLGKNPSMATCPRCGVRGQTVVNYEANANTHLVALFICLVGGICCCCIPYYKNSCKTAKHSCGRCGAYVGTCKN
nr:lipopolysaccharide-induced tumor necrosis factor-alpha factor homolog [Drosophila suzukii]